MAPSTASNNGSESGNNSANNNNNSTNSTTTAIPQPQQPIIQQQKQQQQQSQDKLEEWSQKLADFYHHGITKESLKRHQVPLAIAVLSIVLTGNSGIVYSGILYPLYWLVLRIIAIAVGTAVGLGFATHVYDQLEHWTQQQQQQRREREATSVIAGSNSKSLRRDTAALLQVRASGSLVGGAAAASSGKQYTKVAPTGHHQHHLHQVLQHDDASSYAALMASAGYEVDPNWKRGQVVHQRDPLEPKYPFCDTPVEKQYAIQVMQQEWPTLPSVVQMQLGRFMEFIMRDYVSTWYSMIDYSGGIPYPWCVQNAKDKVACLERGDPWIEPIPPSPPTPPHGDLFPRRMVFSTASTRPLPLLEQMYRSIAVILGNLSHRVQDVNVFQLVLLKWIKVVAHTFKVYRQLRKALLEKQNVHKLALFEEARGGMGHAGRAIIRRAVNTVKNNTGNSGSGSGSGNGTNDPTAAPSNPSLTPTSTTTTAATTTADDSDTAGSESDTAAAATATDETNTNTTTTTTTDRFSGYQPVSEMTITKEFLVTGKLHPACTFGLDIPSLLFADPNGRDCGTGQPGQDPKTFATKRDHMNEDRVLAERLFETNLLKECELDYNRVVASRMIKLLIPRADFGSPILAALLTEIMAGSVLTPVMSVFSPDYLNDWIAKGMDESGSEEQQDGDDTEEGSVEKKKEESKEDGKQESSTSKAPQPQSVMRTWTEEDEGQLNDEDSNRSRNNAVIPSTTRIRSFSEEGEMVLEDNLDEEGRQELGELMDLSDNKDMDLSAYHREAAEDMLGAGASDVAAVGETTTAGSSHGDALAEEDDDADDDDILLEGSTNAAGVSPMITLLHMSLMNLQRHVDMEEARQRGNTGDSKIDWDDKVCQAAVLRLVLVMEALLFHGRRKYPERAPVFSRGTSEAGTSSNASDAGSESNAEPGDEEPPAVKEEFNTTNMTQILMDLTSDIEAFEKMHVKPQDEMVGSNDNKYDDDNAGDVEEEGEGKSSDNDFVPTANDISTLRTLIAAWLHTGQIYRTISTLVKARTTVLKPYYHSYAFLRKPSSASALTDQLKMLDRIDIMVDTVSILNAPRIDLDEEIKLLLEGVDPQEITDSTHSVRDREADSKVVESTSAPMKRGQRFMGLLDKSKKALNEQRKAVAGKAGNIVKKNSLNRSTTTSEPSEVPVPAPDIPAASTPRKEVSAPATYPSPTASNSTSPVTMAQMQQQFAVPGGTPRYLDYHRNEAFASSLRSERDRRMQSWISAIHNDTELVQVVCRMIGCTPEDVAYHRELHHVARIFYAGTNLVGIRDAARSSSNRQRSRLNSAGSTQSVTSAMSEQSTSETQSPEVSLLTVEMACSRRKIEVPDDDSSFLLRAQVSFPTTPLIYFSQCHSCPHPIYFSFWILCYSLVLSTL